MKNPLRSLAGRIILLVFLATVVSALTVSWISVQSLGSFLQQKVDQRFPQMASRISRELDLWYMLRTRELEVFAASTILTESAPLVATHNRRGQRAHDEIEQYLRYVLDSFPQFERLILSNSKGEAHIEIGEGKPLPNGLLSGFTPSLNINSISEAIRINNHLVQIASTPMRDGKGRSIGRLFALINLDHISPTLESRELGENSSVFLVDRDMRILNPPAGLDPDTHFVDPEPDLNRGSRAVMGVAYYDNVQGIHVVGTQIDFPRFGWTLVLEQRYEEAFAPVVSSIGRVAGLSLAIVLLVSLVASRLARSFIQPLRALSDGAERLSKGEREVEIDETTFASEEVNVLTRTFNEMSRGLERTAIELEKSHLAVKAANDELVSKNQELQDVNLVLEQLSITDGLTMLHNHRYFQEAIVRECKRSLRSKDPLSLILIDIDHFKRWNDRLGHAGGDEILRRLAEVLNQCVRETDILTRYGGEEFALIALNTDPEGVVALGEKIRQSVAEEPFAANVSSEQEQLTVSVGVATLYEDRKQLFADADAALYSAKDAGRNRVVSADRTRGPE